MKTYSIKSPRTRGTRSSSLRARCTAIGAGNLILEVQQSSNATYRLYDYNRRGADGKLRPLHLHKALDVLNDQQYKPSDPAACPYFSTARHIVRGGLALPMADGRFASVICVQGEGSLERDGKAASLQRGDSLYLPANGGPADVQGDLQIVVTQAAL